MNRFAAFAIALAVTAVAPQAAAQPATPLDNLLRQDVRLAVVAERLLAANRDLCRRHMPLAGMVLHSRDQYRAEAAGNAFANGAIAVAAVLPGSPAAAAGIAAGDGVAAIDARRT